MWLELSLGGHRGGWSPFQGHGGDGNILYEGYGGQKGRDTERFELRFLGGNPLEDPFERSADWYAFVHRAIHGGSIGLECDDTCREGLHELKLRWRFLKGERGERKIIDDGWMDSHTHPVELSSYSDE